MTISATAGRGRLRARLAILGISTILSSGMIAPAIAQTGLPSVHKNIDENGVDLTDGSFNFSLLEGSVGDETSGIALRRHIGAGGELDNLSVKLRRAETGSDAYIYLTIGNTRLDFRGPKSATSFSDAQGSGATLVKLTASDYRYTAGDGSTLTFGPPPLLTNASNQGFCGTGNQFACGLVAINASSPNGATTTYEWDTGENCRQTGNGVGGEPVFTCAQFWRQRGQSNSFGYRIRFNFVLEANPTTGLPNSNWYKRSGATFYNDRSGGAVSSVAYATPSSTVTQVTDTGGRTWQFTRDAGLSLTGIRRPGASADNITIARDTNGAVSQVTADGVATNYVRSVSGTTATMTVTNALSQQSVVISDLTKGRPTSVTNALGQTTTFAYDSSGRLTQTTAPEGNATSYALDARGNVTQQQAIPKPGSGLAVITTSATYPASCSASNQAICNKPVTTTDARGNVTDYSYDAAHGGMLTMTAPADTNGVRAQVRYSYGAFAGTAGASMTLPTQVSQCRTQTNCVGSADEQRTTIGYDTVNIRPVTITVAAGDSSVAQTSTFAYDNVGNVVSVDGPLSGAADTTRLRYDAARQRIGIVSPDPDGAGGNPHLAQRTTYRPDGQVSSVATGTVIDQSDAAWAAMAVQQSADTGYDGNARPVTASVSAGSTTYSVTQTSYDAVGRIECVAQRMNPGAFGALPSSACSLGTTGSYGPDRIVKTTYDAAGQVAKTTSAYGTAQQADDASATYTANGQVATATDAENNRTSYTYDGFDRLSLTYLPSTTKGTGTSSATDYEQLGYDAAGNVISRRKRDGRVLTYSYDALNRMTVKVVPDGFGLPSWATRDVYYIYDQQNRLINANFDSTTGEGVGVIYDALGRQTSALSVMGGASRTLTYQHDARGNRTRLTWPDGLYATWGYDVLDRNIWGGDSQPAGLYALYYAGSGERSAKLSGNWTYYGYDPASRLTSLADNISGGNVTRNFGYSPAGQIVSATRDNDAYAFASANTNISTTTNGLNQVTVSGGATLGYDANGNLISDGTSTFLYDVENRLLAKSNGAELRYDPLGRLWQSYGPNQGTTRYLYDGNALVAEYDASGNMLKRYLHGPGVDEPLVEYGGSILSPSNSYLLKADQQGSIVARTDWSGNLAGSPNAYDEYGQPAPGNAGRFGYTGQIWLPEVGLWHYKARMYAPGLGRFMQTDPIGYADGMNWYDYVGSDPVNATDPSGTACWFASRITGCGNGRGKYADGPASVPGVGGDATESGDVTVTGARRIAPTAADQIAAHGRRPSTVGAGAIAERAQVMQVAKRVVKSVTCALGAAADAVQEGLNAAGEGVGTALDAVHDVIFPPAYGAPDATPGQARVALSNKAFKQWFHQVYKRQQGIGGYGNRNDDMSPAEVMDAFGEWNETQASKAKKRGC